MDVGIIQPFRNPDEILKFLHGTILLRQSPPYRSSRSSLSQQSDRTQAAEGETEGAGLLLFLFSTRFALRVHERRQLSMTTVDFGMILINDETEICIKRNEG